MNRLQRLAATPVLEAGLVICWSSGFIGGTLASATSSIFLVLFWRFFLATAILAPFAVSRFKRLSGQQIALQALIGALAMFGYLATVISAIDHGVPAGTAALITALQPLATAALAGIVLAEPVSARQWVGLFIGFSGVALAVTGSIDQAPLWGYALALLSMTCIVTATLVAKRQPQPIGLLPSLTIQCAVSAALFLPLALLDGAILPESTKQFGYAVAWFIALSTLGAYSLYWANLVRTSATRVSSLIYLTPPVTAIWAFAMFGEPITFEAIGGLFVCLIGVYLAKSQPPHANTPMPPRTCASET